MSILLELLLYQGVVFGSCRLRRYSLKHFLKGAIGSCSRICQEYHSSFWHKRSKNLSLRMLDVHNDPQNYPKQLNEILKKKTHKCAPIQIIFLKKSKLFYIKDSNTFLLSHLASLSTLFFFSSSFLSSRGKCPIGAESCLAPPQRASLIL